MTAKWIKELEDIYSDGGEWDDFLPILERINSLLKVAGIQAEDPNIADRIQKETGKIFTRKTKMSSKLEFVDDKEVEEFLRGD